MNWKKDSCCNWFKNKVCCNKSQKEEPSIRQEIESFFGNLFDKYNKNVPTNLDSFQPKINISENKEEYRISVDLPGVNKRDLRLSINNGFLTISGETSSINEEHDENYHTMERSFGTFRRQISLPNNIHEENISTKFINGVLNITLQKKEKNTPNTERFIDIED